MNEFETYKSLFLSEHYTCLLFDEKKSVHSFQRGVAPLLDWIENAYIARGASAIDKVVGKAAAYLYVLLKVKNVYAFVISQPALEVFRDYGINVQYDTLVSMIRNRTDTGFCPMETAVRDCNSPEEAYLSIQAALKKMRSGPEA